MARKNFAATGSFLAADRPRALDLLGFSSQLIFNTFHNRRLRDWEHSGDVELAVGAARAHNRGMVEFCSVDRRLLPSCYVPWPISPAAAMADEAIAMGAPRSWWPPDARRATRPATSDSIRSGPGRRRWASRSSSTSAARAT